MKKTYKTPLLVNGMSFNLAAPLAFFSVATAAAAITGLAAGAVATKAAIRALPTEKRNMSLAEVKG